jgi:hypothetical protein
MMMILCDGGGSNVCSHHIAKQDSCRLSNLLKMNILMVHYLFSCSKYNPIEHKLFSHISRSWQGVPFYNIQFVKELTDKTFTSKWLTVYTQINDKQYPIKRPVDENFKSSYNNQILFDDKIPKWNYLIKPT